MEKDLLEKFRLVDYEWINPYLLEQALSHPSYTHEYNSTHLPSEALEHNERLEYLGDSLLGALVSAELYKRYPHLNEGELSKARMGIVNGKRLSALARESLSLDSYLKVGKGERMHQAQIQDGPLSDAFEALIGALFLDMGEDLKLLREVLLRLIPDLLYFELSSQDPKSRLQEIFMKAKRPLPIYQTLSASEEVGPFEVALLVEGKEVAKVIDNSKKKAHQLLAQIALEQLIN